MLVEDELDEYWVVDEEDLEDQEHPDIDAMDQDLEIPASESEMREFDVDTEDSEHDSRRVTGWSDIETPVHRRKAQMHAKPTWLDENAGEGSGMGSISEVMESEERHSITLPSRILPISEETPTRPRVRNARKR